MYLHAFKKKIATVCLRKRLHTHRQDLCVLNYALLFVYLVSSFNTTLFICIHTLVPDDNWFLEHG